ncbi:endonuclease/exonuclease/phosphatase family protein [Kribbella sp. VKM Ac-2566]|uniref:endonuclease/exonuclease/phosphatase family protein n=1 Tax=Kribbella sp. VKM Ac-2566 TaxID=2512218 RepID=UPI0010D2AE11|nr:endonuclease/exonuclease/phosphatase family protein [Kribbella sp. VKM Ac-2566]TDW98552.1 endonuclease/exonuclease/phosphatase family protein [Kribbella sp. VKM Ac-2566]
MFTIMTWNVENFFTPKPTDRAAYDVKVAELKNVIETAAPDLLALQEIGDEASFEALRAALGGNWTGVLSTHFESPHTIRVGWLSPGDLSDVQEVVDLPAALSPVTVDDHGTAMTQLGRGALAVTYTTPAGATIRALTAHLKSKLLTFPGHRFDTKDETERARYGVYALDRRAAEAAAVRDWATASLADTWEAKPLLVCGDLNDTMDAATTQLLYGPPGSQIGTGGFNHPDDGDPQRLWDIGYKMTPPNDYSRINQGRHELIDHILVSHAMISHLTDAATVPLDVPSVGLQPNTAPRTDPPSDHRPVVGHFDI